MSEFKPGEIVNITIKGVRVERVTPMNHGPVVLQIAHPSAPGDGIHLSPDAPGVTVERVAPAEWPPQPGDLWAEVGGTLWFAQNRVSSHITLVPAIKRGADDFYPPAHALERFGPLTLVYREGGEPS